MIKFRDTRFRLRALTAAGLSGLLALPALSVAQNASTQPATSRADLPTADEILKRAVDAMGGKDAFDQIESVHVKMRDMLDTTEIRVQEVWCKGEERVLAREVDHEQDSRFEVGRVGSITWKKDASGVRPSQIDVIRGFRDKATLQRTFVTIRNEYGSLEVVGRETRLDDPCFKLRLAEKKDADPSKPEPESYMFFHAKTGLPHGIQIVDPNDPETAHDIFFREWKDIDDFHLFTHVETKTPAGQRIIHYDLIEYNSVADDRFVVPDGLSQTAKQEEPSPDAADPDDPAAQLTPDERAQIEKQLKQIFARKDLDGLRDQVTLIRNVMSLVPEDERPKAEYTIMRIEERIAELVAEGNE